MIIIIFCILVLHCSKIGSLKWICTSGDKKWAIEIMRSVQRISTMCQVNEVKENFANGGNKLLPFYSMKYLKTWKCFYSLKWLEITCEVLKALIIIFQFIVCAIAISGRTCSRIDVKIITRKVNQRRQGSILFVRNFLKQK